MGVPFQKHEVAEYERKRYRGWDQKIVDSREKNILRRYLNKIGRQNDKVLDLPCGYGRFSELLLDAGYEQINCDISQSMVERACARNQELYAGPGWGAVADAKQGLPFVTETFSLVFSMRFFHHLHDQEARKAILKEFSRVSRGWVIVSFYQTNSLHVLQRHFRSKITKSSTRIKMLSRQDFVREAALAGLTVVRISPLIKGLHSQHLALLKKSGVAPD